MNNEKSKGNILVVDDTPVNLHLLTALLSQNGYEVRPAPNGSLALRTVESKRPDLILLDIKLPDLSGYEVCSRLKASEHSRDIPVIFISALGDSMEKVKGFQVGGIDYITKPFAHEEVLIRVKTHLMIQQKKLELQIKNTQLEQEILARQHVEEALQKSNENLEERVEERTKALSRANQALQQEIEERKQAEKQAKSANRAKSEFLANMSHEIRTPMNAVIGFSDLLSNMVTDKKQKSYLDSIQTGGKMLLTLINDILDLAKIEAGRLEIQLEPIDPRIIFAELKQLFALKMAEKGLEFQIEIDDMLPTALVFDAHRLRQVLLNLISNAIKFTEQGHVKINVHQCDKDNNTVDLIIAVEDTGIGIPKNQQDKIFESFQQVDGQSTRKYGGTGLGLAITKRLISMMQGEITLQSQVGAGSVFKITLRDVTVSKVAPPVKTDDGFDINTISFEPARILVVDDIESNRDVIRENLSKVNLEVIEADNGHNGLLFAQEYQPDLILMDLRMPVMDGYEATKQLKQNPSTQNIPVIALTATVMGEQSKALDFDGFLFKPVKMSNLLSELSRYLKHTIQPIVDVEEIDSNITTSVVEKSPELIEALNKLMPVWEKIRGASNFKKVKKFAADIKRLGDEYHLSYVSSYGDNLCELAQNFDFGPTKKLLKKFPELRNFLKGL